MSKRDDYFNPMNDVRQILDCTVQRNNKTLNDIIGVIEIRWEVGGCIRITPGNEKRVAERFITIK